jgi:hypothetical protein
MTDAKNQRMAAVARVQQAPDETGYSSVIAVSHRSPAATQAARKLAYRFDHYSAIVTAHWAEHLFRVY